MNHRWGQFFMAQRGQFRMAFDTDGAMLSVDHVAQIRHARPGFRILPVSQPSPI
jgi:hypothetical protein